MASRKKQEDKHLNILRELVSQQNNKKCFDCGQRGPTYVNMTIGAYVCTSCSGLLRGLNPPHRIKSISMATFSSTEIDFLQKHGNEVCRNTWLGLWDSNHPAEPESREEQKVKDFLIKKYERKTWYSSQPKQKPVPQSVPEAKPLKQLLGENTTEAKASLPAVNQTAQQSQQKLPPTQEQPPKSKFDLLGDLGSDPFGSNNKHQNQSQGFAAFGGMQQKDPFGESAASSQFTNQQPFENQPSASQHQHSDPFGSQPQSSAFNSNAQQSSLSTNQSLVDSNDFFGGTSSSAPFEAFGSTATVPPANTQTSNGSFDFFGNTPDIGKSSVQSSSFNAFATSSVPNQGAMLTESDRYKALSELDDVFRSSNTQSVFSTTSSAANASRETANQQPNPFMSPASGTSGIAMFQQQQQKAPNPFQPGPVHPQNQSSQVQAGAFQKNPQQFNQGKFGQSNFGMNQGFANAGQPGFASNQLAYSAGQGGFVNSQPSSMPNQMNFGNQQSFNSGKTAFSQGQGQMMAQQGQFSGQQQGQFGGQQQGQFGGQQQGQFSGHQQGQFSGQQQGFGGQQQMYNPQQLAFNGQQNAFGASQNMSGQQFGAAQQGFGGQQQSAFQTANFGMQNQMPGQMQNQFQTQMPGGFTGQQTQQQQQQQQFGTWAQSSNKGVGTFGMGGIQTGMVQQKSTNPFM